MNNSVLLRVTCSPLCDYEPDYIRVVLSGLINKSLLNGHIYIGSQTATPVAAAIDTGNADVGFGGLYIIKHEDATHNYSIFIQSDGLNDNISITKLQTCMFRPPGNVHPLIRSAAGVATDRYSFIIIGAH